MIGIEINSMRQTKKAKFLFSPSDLITFLGCHHALYLDLKRHTDGIEPSQDSTTNKLLQEKGYQHEEAYLQSLKDQGKTIIEIPKNLSSQERGQLTIEALKSGVDVIYQARFYDYPWRGDADFLIRTEQPSNLGVFSYEVYDTKLSRTPEPKHVMQLCVYSELLEKSQGIRPKLMHLVLGDNSLAQFKVDDFFQYYQKAKERFETYVTNPPVSSYPEPCNHCQFCHWRDRCKNQWQDDDHLSLVANIQRSQIDKLLKANVDSVGVLAALSPDTKIEELNTETFSRLHSQAALQAHKRNTDDDKFEILNYLPTKGFERLPLPDEGDLFFDMEGDPLYPSGLEYLFGVYYRKNGKEIFKPFWAHSHEEEHQTFKEFMSFISEHIAQFPNAFIYHYNHYETTGLKRLACRYGACEEQLDILLRQRKFVDLYQVVRESIRTSEPGYLIKNLETFYMEKRDNAVATAMDSIIVYNQWRVTSEPQLLQEIADYNEVDCVSTLRLRDWLLKLKPSNSSWFDINQQEEKDFSRERYDWEIEYEMFQKKLTCDSEHPDAEMRKRLIHLLEFHHREYKPKFWAMYERQNKFVDELIDDAECIGGLTRFGTPELIKQSYIYSYYFPPQEYKLRVDESVTNAATRKSTGSIIELDDHQCIVKIKLGAKSGEPPEMMSIAPGYPASVNDIRAAIYRVASNVAEEKDDYQAIRDILKKELPRIQGRTRGEPIIQSSDLQSEILEVITHLDNSYLFIQGPPGAGKTFTCSHVIAELIRNGKKIGVASNSHKAIHNILDGIESVAAKTNLHFKGLKKASKSNKDSYYHGNYIENTDNKGQSIQGYSLVAGTAWFFSEPHLDGQLDYLFVDEAGQVAVANIVAMGSSAKNIILVGDQMQLSQPIQGTHPDDAGLSILDFLLDAHATIPPAKGVFLDNTRRMRQSIGRFISQAFYDGRLQSHECTTDRALVFDDISLPNEGIHLIAANHEGCSQKSVEEGNIIKSIYNDLLAQHFINGSEPLRQLTLKDILIVTPYNVQANYLQSILPDGARVGTVDKFQGQEAPIVIISMVTSSVEDLPRNIEFLYSKNRMNVAISRAQCLAVVVANPNLMEVPCKTVEQMKLVNTFCWLNEYSKSSITE